MVGIEITTQWCHGVFASFPVIHTVVTRQLCVFLVADFFLNFVK